MPSPIPPHDAQRALAALGVTALDIDALRRTPIEQARQLLQDLKVKARRNYKRLALELHPDRTQGDAAKAEFFVLLGRVLEELDKTEVRPAPTPLINVSFTPVSWQQAMRAQQGYPTWTTVSTTSASTTTTTVTAQQVIRIVRMRPR